LLKTSKESKLKQRVGLTRNYFSEDLELKNLENQLKILLEEEGGGFSSLETKTNLLRMEEWKNRLIKEKEEMWRLKSNAIWMKSGDENTKKIQAYAKGRKFSNTIWHLKDQYGTHEHTFEGMSRIGKKYFQELFKAENKATIEEVI
jgi:hypothetical protein